MLYLSEDDLSKLLSPVKAVRVGDETWLIPPSSHLTGLVSSSASDWSGEEEVEIVRTPSSGPSPTK